MKTKLIKLLNDVKQEIIKAKIDKDYYRVDQLKHRRKKIIKALKHEI